jgi:hypothetical protein
MAQAAIRELRSALRRREIRRQGRGLALDRVLETGAVFVHVPKCGGKSVVRDIYGLAEHEWFGHAGIGFYQALLGPRRFASAFKFAFLRDPVSRCRSGFAFRQRGGFGLPEDLALQPELEGLNFERFVMDGALEAFARKDVVFGPQAPRILLPDGRIGVDRICAFENFAEEMRDLPVPHRLEAPSHLNAAPRAPAAPPPAEVRRRIAEIYEQDYRVLAGLGAAAPAWARDAAPAGAGA